MATTTTTTTTTTAPSTRETRSKTGNSKPRVLETLGITAPTTKKRTGASSSRRVGRPAGSGKKKTTTTTKKTTTTSAAGRKTATGRVTKPKTKAASRKKGPVKRVGEIASGVGEKIAGAVERKPGKKASGTAKVRGTKQPRTKA